MPARDLFEPIPGPFVCIPHFRSAHSSYQKHLLLEAFREVYHNSLLQLSGAELTVMMSP